MVLTVHVLRRQQTFTFITFNWLPLVNTYNKAERGNDSVRSSVCSCVRRITENFYVFLGGQPATIVTRMIRVTYRSLSLILMLCL